MWIRKFKHLGKLRMYKLLSILALVIITNNGTETRVEVTPTHDAITPKWADSSFRGIYAPLSDGLYIPNFHNLSPGCVLDNDGDE